MSGGWGRKAENKPKAQPSTDIIPSKLITELHYSARLGGWVGEMLGKRLISASWSRQLIELGKKKRGNRWFISLLQLSIP